MLERETASWPVQTASAIHLKDIKRKSKLHIQSTAIPLWQLECSLRWNAATSDQGSEVVTLDAPSVAGGSVYNTEGEDEAVATDTERDTGRDDSRLLKGRVLADDLSHLKTIHLRHAYIH